MNDGNEKTIRMNQRRIGMERPSERAREREKENEEDAACGRNWSEVKRVFH